jgi:hypothetical protein
MQHHVGHRLESFNRQCELQVAQLLREHAEKSRQGLLLDTDVGTATHGDQAANRTKSP